MATALEQLKTHLSDITTLGSVGALISWEEQTYMPEGGTETRANQLALLARMRHEMFTDSKTARLLDEAATELANAPADHPDQRLVAVARHDYELATKLPAEFVAEQTRQSSLAHLVWVNARKNNDYGHFKPALQKMFELARQQAEYLGYEDRIYDALLDNYEPGFKSRDVDAMFGELKAGLIPLIAAIREREDRVDASFLHRPYDVAKQAKFTEQVASAYGFSFHHGRQDKAPHPFCQSISSDDVRITTRFYDNFLNSALFGTMHETGHGLYEQGAKMDGLHIYMRTGTSLGVHESQSRLWENIVGRSRGFWKGYYPKLQATFPESLGDVELEMFYRAVNKSAPSLIRVEADEVTYNMHIIIRYEMETELLEGRLSFDDAPAAWNAKYQSYLGITPPTDSDGILQDIHWSAGLIAYFPTYTIGNVLSAQLYEKALAAHPTIPAEIEAGQFSTLLGWLRTHVHQYGRMFYPQDLIQRVTGDKLNARAYLSYLRTKYSELYELENVTD